MKEYKKEFIKYSLNADVLRFDEFTLKSGRISPYFFNSGLFNDGNSLLKLGEFYAQAIHASGLQFDMLYGPAYKGIPLVASIAIAYTQLYQRNLPYCFDRKEEKDHAEGGLTLGAKLSGRVLIVDDVITAGTSVNYAVDLIDKQGANAVGVAIALDRQEQGKTGGSAVAEVEKEHGLIVSNIICLADLVQFLGGDGDYKQELERVAAYQKQYGTTIQTKTYHSCRAVR